MSTIQQLRSSENKKAIEHYNFLNSLNSPVSVGIGSVGEKNKKEETCAFLNNSDIRFQRYTVGRPNTRGHVTGPHTWLK